MKAKLTIFLSLFIAVLIIGCGKSDNKTTENKTDKQTTEQQTQPKEEKSENKTLQVSGSDKALEIQCSGMTCVGCEKTIKSKVKKVDGVKDVIADHNTNVVKASYDPAKTNPDAIKEAITSAGYKVESVK